MLFKLNSKIVVEKFYIVRQCNRILHGVNMPNNTLQVRVEFSGELLKRLEIIRKYYGIENATEVIRVLVNDKYKQLFPKEA